MSAADSPSFSPVRSFSALADRPCGSVPPSGAGLHRRGVEDRVASRSLRRGPDRFVSTGRLPRAGRPGAPRAAADRAMLHVGR